MSASQAVYLTAQVRELDRIAIEQYNIPSIQLMRRAGEAMFCQIEQMAVPNKTLTVYCGTGNNGGDGWMVAGLAKKRNYSVQLLQVGDAKKISGDAQLARQFALSVGVDEVLWSAECQPQGLIIDALLGTGLQCDPSGDYMSAIEQINNSQCKVLAADIPSGLCADSGWPGTPTVHAEKTVTFVGNKCGLYTGRGRTYSGKVHYDTLNIPEAAFTTIPSAHHLLSLPQLLAHFPQRAIDAHKGHFGHLFIIGGDQGMGGAPILAALAAAHIGTGLVSLCTHPDHPSILPHHPEIMVHRVASGQELIPLLSDASAIVIGPGLGQRTWGQQLLDTVLHSDKKLLLDADALNLIATRQVQYNRRNAVITPHPGEAGALLNKTSEDIQRQRFNAAQALYDRYAEAVVLKGSGTLICTGTHTDICPYGNAGMASGGMGDLLSGVIGGLLAQGCATHDAVRLGTCLHARAGDITAAHKGQHGMLASDLLQPMRQLLNGQLL